MIIHVLRTILFLLFPTLLIAQNITPDKYKNITDTAEISKLFQKANKYVFSNPDSCKYFVNIAENIAIKTKSNVHLMKINYYYGIIHIQKSEYKKSVASYKKANNIAQKLNNKSEIAYSNMGISSAYLYLGYYSLSKKHLLDAQKYYEKVNNYKELGGIYLNKTFINIEQKDYDLAEINGKLAYENYVKYKSNAGITRALINQIEINYYLKNYNKSIKKANEALHYALLSNQLSLRSHIYLGLGNAYLALNKLDSALHNYNETIKFNKKWGDSYILSKTKHQIAKVFYKQNNYKKAISNALKSFQIADSNQLVEVKTEVSNSLALFFSKTKNYEKAFKYKQIELQINDSLFTEKKYKVQNEIEAIYQTEKKLQKIKTLSKEKEISILKNQQSNYYILALISFIFVIVIVGILFFRNSKSNSKRKSIELEQRLLRSQMNPHFIFNAISSIQEYIMDKNPLEASSYLSSFAKLMRSILNNSATEFISLEDEIETLENYLKLQKLRFSNKLDYEIKVPESMEIEDLAIPPMLSQPFIENSVKHGIAKKEGKGIIIVEFYEKENSLYLKVEDNGGGIKNNEKKIDNGHKSMALQITKSRIANFKKKYKKNVHLEIKNIQNKETKEKGVQVIFELPKKYIN